MLHSKTSVLSVLLTALCSFAAVDLSQAQQSDAQASSRGWVLPPGWQLSYSSEERAARRYISPDGQSSVLISVSPSGLRGFEGAAGERVTYQRRGRSWMVVSGLSRPISVHDELKRLKFVRPTLGSDLAQEPGWTQM